MVQSGVVHGRAGMSDSDGGRAERAREALAAARFVLADLDGTLIFGGAAASGAPELLDHCAGRLAVVSNYSTVTAAQMSARLAAMRLNVPPERIFLAGELMVRDLAARAPGARVLCVMAQPMRRLASDLGLQLVDDDPEVLLIGRDLELSYDRLAAAMRAVHRGAKVFASNLDKSHPGDDAMPVPETGSLVAAIVAAAPATPVTVIGKPRPDLFHAALRVLDATAAETVMLGDNPDTDGAGARSLGIGSILIGRAPEADVATLANALPAAWRATT